MPKSQKHLQVAQPAGLLDEIEQLRTALESALEENARLVEDRDGLLRRVSVLARELQSTQAAHAPVPRASPGAEETENARINQAEEELRVAFEELQVLTEELEVSNNSLHLANQDLDAKIEDRTRQLQDINSALRSTEGSLRTIADLVPDLLWRMNSEGQADWFNRRWFDYTGHDPGEPLGEGWLQAIHPVDRPTCGEIWGRSLATGAPYQNEQRMRDESGNYRWFLVRAEPMRDETGNIMNWFAAGADVHERWAAMEALQQSELRFRTLVEGMPQLVWRAIGAGQWTWCSPQWTAFTGQRSKASHGRGWLQMVHPDDRDTARRTWSQAQEAGILEMEVRILEAAENRYRQFRTRALPVRVDGVIVEWLGTSTNVDDIWQLRQQQTVLVAELQHRTRNLMAIVRSIATRTMKDVDSLDEFWACFDDRLRALARVQALLSQREGGLRVPFDVLLREELSAHVTLDTAGGKQVSLEGSPGISLKSSTVQTLALAIHELATNAVKYGALSQPTAHLHVSWGVKQSAEDEGQKLWVDWRESGVNISTAKGHPPGSGYGRELIEKALPYQLGASTKYLMESDGVHCKIEIVIPPEEDPTNTETTNG
jgi:PAS domain S-box-containing protein